MRLSGGPVLRGLAGHSCSADAGEPKQSRQDDKFQAASILSSSLPAPELQQAGVRLADCLPSREAATQVHGAGGCTAHDAWHTLLPIVTHQRVLQAEQAITGPCIPLIVPLPLQDELSVLPTLDACLMRHTTAAGRAGQQWGLATVGRHARVGLQRDQGPGGRIRGVQLPRSGRSL